MTVVDRWWCAYHGLSIFYQLERGDPIRRCGQPLRVTFGPIVACRFPVRRERSMDRIVESFGVAALDHYLQAQTHGGRNG